MNRAFGPNSVRRASEPILPLRAGDATWGFGLPSVHLGSSDSVAALRRHAPRSLRHADRDRRVVSVHRGKRIGPLLVEYIDLAAMTGITALAGIDSW